MGAWVDRSGPHIEFRNWKKSMEQLEILGKQTFGSFKFMINMKRGARCTKSQKRP